MPCGSEKAGEMLYRYRLYSADGSFEGEAHYAVPIEPGETIWTGDGRKLLVVGETRAVGLTVALRPVTSSGGGCDRAWLGTGARFCMASGAGVRWSVAPSAEWRDPAWFRAESAHRLASRHHRPRLCLEGSKPRARVRAFVPGFETRICARSPSSVVHCGCRVLREVRHGGGLRCAFTVARGRRGAGAARSRRASPDAGA